MVGGYGIWGWRTEQQVFYGSNTGFHEFRFLDPLVRCGLMRLIVTQLFCPVTVF